MGPRLRLVMGRSMIVGICHRKIHEKLFASSSIRLILESFFGGRTTGLKLGNRVMVGEDGLLRRTDKKMKLSDKPLGSDPNSKFQIFVVV